MANEYDVIVVGSGPGGATVAREMSRRGKKVLMCERGGNWKALGNTLSIAMLMQWVPLIFSKQANVVMAASNYGGASVISCGAAVAPPKKVFDKVGVDLSAEAEEAKAEMWIDVLPDELVGKTNFRLLEAANELGYNWTKTQRFVDHSRCVPDCSDCMLGCPRSAKWSARIYGDDALRHGAEVVFNTRIHDIIKQDGKAIGVTGTQWGKKVQFYGKKVVLSGGVGNVGILRRAGLSEAGRSFAVDWLQFIGGVIPGMNTVHEQPMAVGTLEHYESDGIIILPVFPNWAMLGAMLPLKSLSAIPWIKNAFSYTGIMVKIQDELQGEIYPDNLLYTCSKEPTAQDKKRLQKGVDIIRKVLVKAGAPSESIMELAPSGAHPSASCRIGEVVDKNLQTRLENLYCCDASVVPESLGLPVVWTAVSLGKRLSKHLDKQLS